MLNERAFSDLQVYGFPTLFAEISIYIYIAPKIEIIIICSFFETANYTIQ